jgi:hypothetical protein
VDIIHIKNCVFHSIKCGNVDNFFVRVEKRCVLSDFTAGFLWKDSCFPRYCLILWKTIHIKNRIKNRISGILLILGFRSHSFSARKQTQSNLCETKKAEIFYMAKISAFFIFL